MKKTSSNPKNVVEQFLLNSPKTPASKLGEYSRVLMEVAAIIEKYGAKSETKPFRDYAMVFHRAASKVDKD